MKDTHLAKDVYIVDGARTPFLKARGVPGPFAAADLGVQACNALVNRLPIEATDFDEVVTGCVIPSANEANISRVISLRAGCGDGVPAYTVQRNCASGLQALDTAAINIAIGRSNLVLAGGTEAMSHAPLLFNDKMTLWFSNWFKAKTLTDKLKLVGQLRPSFIVPVISLLCGLSDPVVGLSMGQTAENVAFRFKITREEMDEYALQSHQRLMKAQDEGLLSEIVPIYAPNNSFYDYDDGIRRDSTLEKLSRMKPYFDKKYGSVTAANSSQVTDGAAFLVLASEKAVKKHNLPVMGRIVDSDWGALDASEMGLGPVHAMTPILQRQHLAIDDVDLYEINEAFAAQVLGCIRAWEDEDYCKEKLGLKGAFGTLSQDKLNIQGGAIALGHPIGSSGARLVLHMLKLLEQENKSTGMVSLCIGGGQGGAMLVERVNEVVS